MIQCHGVESWSIQCVPVGPDVARFTLLMLLFLQNVYCVMYKTIFVINIVVRVCLQHSGAL